MVDLSIKNGGSFPLKMVEFPIKNGDFPIKNGGSFHSYVKVYQRV